MEREEAIKILKRYYEELPAYIDKLKQLELVSALKFSLEEIVEYIGAYANQMRKLKLKFSITEEEINGI